MYQINEKALAQIRSNTRLRARLAYDLEKHPDTIDRWFRLNDEHLTTYAALLIIKEETGLTEKELLSKVIN